MDEKTPVRRSMVGAPPSSSKSARSTRVSAVSKPTNSRKRNVKEEEADLSDNEPHNESGTEGAHSDADEISTPKTKKKMKKRGTVTQTTYSQRSKAKAKVAAKRKRDIEEGIIDEEEPELEKEPELAPEVVEEEDPEPEMKAPEIRKYSSFQLLCDHLLRKLMGKDPEEYFAFPVTPSMAPDYHSIITIPMDFSQMRQKIEDDKYETIPEMGVDAQLIVSNALAYNHPNTVYHLAATRLSQISRYYFSEQYLRYIFHTLPFANDIPIEKTGLSPLAQLQNKHENKRKQAIVDTASGKEIVASVPEPIRTRLSTRVPVLKNTHLAFVDNKEGATVLNIIGSENNGEKKVVKLGNIVGPLEEGTPGMFAPIDTRPNGQAPMSYLEYGPFCSFAPQFDSTWACINKRDSDLLLRTYGDRANAADTLALCHLVKDCDSHMQKVVDDLLDTLTDGEHSKTISQLELKKEQVPSSTDDINLEELLSEVSSLDNLGLDVSFVEDIRRPVEPQQFITTQEILDNQGQALQDLAHLQHTRLSAAPPISLNHAQQPTDHENRLAAKIVTSIAETVHQYAPPEDLVSTPAIHNAIGIQNQEFDMDILSEFFQ